MVELVYVNQTANADRFKGFLEQLNEFTESLGCERMAVDKAMKQAEMQQAEADSTFEDRVSEYKEKSGIELKQLDSILRDLTEYNKKLHGERNEWSEKQKEAHVELMSALDGDEVVDVERQFGEQFEALIGGMNSLSHQSMNDQLTALINKSDSLNIEKNQLKVSITDQSSTISEMWSVLKPTYGVVYTERNALRIMIRHQVTKVRTEYQNSRLLEESLKAKLGN